MTRKIYALLALILSLTIPVNSPASTPPPPVNQNLGMPDAVSNDMTTNDCGTCHFNPDTAPAPVKSGYLPDRHHLRLDTPIEEYSASPYPDKSSDGTHKCITCHLLDWVEDPSRPLGGYFKFALEPSEPEFRNCLNCHEQIPGTTSVHHLTKKAQTTNCNACHGSLINDPNGELWQLRVIPTMSPNPGFGDGDIGETGNRMGGCRYCHNGGTDAVTGRVIPGPNANMLTHHGTGLGQPGSGTTHGCDLCHDISPPNHTLQGCVRCHAPTSLHSIQADSDGNGTAGDYEEQPFFGHIGTSSDCMGCHMGGTATAASTARAFASEEAPLFGPLLPKIEEINMARIIAGNTATLLLTGAGYMVANDNNKITTKVVLKPNENDTPPLEITPSNVTFTTMEVQIPADLSPGNYSLSAVNGNMSSIPVNLTILPSIKADSAICENDITTINGSGFGSYIDLLDSGIGVTDTSSSQACEIHSWNDEQITAKCSLSAKGPLKIENIFSYTTVELEACKGNGRPDWWDIWSWWSNWGWSGR